MSIHRFTVTVGAADVAGVLPPPEERPGPWVIAYHVVHRRERLEESRRRRLALLPHAASTGRTR